MATRELPHDRHPSSLWFWTLQWQTCKQNQFTLQGTEINSWTVYEPRELALFHAQLSEVASLGYATAGLRSADSVHP